MKGSTFDSFLAEEGLLEEVNTLVAERQHQEQVRKLEERVCFAEQARDNAIAMRDEALQASKLRGASAGRRISQLVELVREATDGMSKDAIERFEQRLAEILEK